MDVRRELLLERVATCAARLISLVAPAGFGKSTVAQMIAEGCGGAITCDLARCPTLWAIARYVVEAIGSALPEGLSSDDLARFVLNTWISAEAPATWVFDNLESLSDAQSIDLLLRMIKSAGERTIILCSRAPLPFLNSRWIPPNEHLHFGIDDLAFTPAETGTFFAGLGVDAHLERIVTLTQGWPVAVLMLRQIAREGRLEHVLERSGTHGLIDLRDYLMSEVLGSLSEVAKETLLALVATQDHGWDAPFLASNGLASSEALRALSQALPLVRQSAAGRYMAHPLIASLLEDISAPTLARYRVTAAEWYEADGMLCEAARLYLAAGREHSAAACLERLAGSYLDHNAFAGCEGLIERLPATLLAAYPLLWAMVAYVRRAVVTLEELLTEGFAIRERLTSNLQSLEAMQVSALLIMVATQIGDHASARRLLLDYEIVEDSRAPGNIALLTADMCRRMLIGRTAGMLERYRRLVPYIHNDLVRAYLILRIEVVAATMCGRFDDARDALRRALHHAGTSGTAPALAGIAYHQAMIEWLAGDEVATEAFDLAPFTRAYAMLQMAGKAQASELRRELLGKADIAAREADDLWAQLLLAVARAMSEPAERAAELERARRLAEEIGQPPLAASVASLQTGGNGEPALAALARRFGGPAAGVAMHVFRINALSHTVWRDNEEIVVSNRVRTLLVTLAVLKRVRRDELLNLLWEDADESRANALKMLLSRARHQLGDPTVIEVEHGSFALRANVRVDIDEIEELLRSLGPMDRLSDSQREILDGAYQQCRSSDHHETLVSSIDATISTLRHELMDRLGVDALERGEIPLAFRFASELRRDDEHDERAYELMIRAHARSGRTAQALREYRNYCDHLVNHVGMTPPATLEELLSS